MTLIGNPKPSKSRKFVAVGHIYGYLKLLDVQEDFPSRDERRYTVPVWTVQCLGCMEFYKFAERDILRASAENACCLNCVSKIRAWIVEENSRKAEMRKLARQEKARLWAEEHGRRKEEKYKHTGDTVGRLTVLAYLSAETAGPLGSGWLCRCSLCAGFEVVPYRSGLSVRGKGKKCKKCVQVDWETEEAKALIRVLENI